MASGKSGKRLVLFTAGLLVNCAIPISSASIAAESVNLWQVYETALKSAKYVDAALGYPAQAMFAARGILPWHQTQPGRELAPTAEAARVLPPWLRWLWR